MRLQQFYQQPWQGIHVVIVYHVDRVRALRAGIDGSASCTAVFDCHTNTMNFVVFCTRGIETNNVCTCSHTCRLLAIQCIASLSKSMGAVHKAVINWFLTKLRQYSQPDIIHTSMTAVCMFQIYVICLLLYRCCNVVIMIHCQLEIS